MSGEIVIFPAKACEGISELTDKYLTVIKRGNQHQNEVLGYEFAIRASVYRRLIPIATRQGLSVQTFIQRLCEHVIETTPEPGERPFS